MPAKPVGVYGDSRNGWYFKVTLGRDPLTGRRLQVTRRGFRTATEAARARRDLIARVDVGAVRPSSTVLTVNELLDLYLDGLDADERLSAKTRFDYRHYAQDYVRPLLGAKKVRDLTPDGVVAWQRALTKGGGVKNGKPLAANTIRLARSPLSGALKLAVSMGVLGVNPAAAVPRPRAPRSIPKHWTPEQAREFLDLMEGDRTYPVLAFLLGSGLRIGELVYCAGQTSISLGATCGWWTLPPRSATTSVASAGKSGRRANHRPRRRPRPGPAPATDHAEPRAPRSSDVREERFRLHEAERRLLPPAVLVADDRPLLRGASAAAAHGPRAAAYECDSDVGQWCAAQGRG